jgi:hypothetical protein
MGAAVAIGFFPALSAHAVNPYSVWDAVPGDLVASAILATAAAVCRGLQRSIAAATGSGAWGAAGAPPADLAGSFLADDVVLVHAAGDDSSPTASSSSAAAAASTTTPLVSRFRLGKRAAAARAAAAAAASPPSKSSSAPQPLIIVHAATSTTYPATVYEAYNTAVDFLRAHGSPVSILFGGARYLPSMPPTWRPSPQMVGFWKVYNWVKVAIVCFLLRCWSRVQLWAFGVIDGWLKCA